MLVFVVIIIAAVLYIAYINKGFGLINTTPKKSSGGFSGKAGDFQPGSEKSNFPGKLKWGRDF